MGLIFDEPEEVSAEPPWGAQERDTLSQVVKEMTSVGSNHGVQTLVDCVNVRYRSKAYRDHIKLMRDKGWISQSQINDMRSSLNRIRYQKRTPAAKAFRSQWP